MGQSSINACNASLAARNNELNGGKVEIRTGAAGDIDSAPTGILLETIPLNATAFNEPVNRSATAILPTAIVSVSNASAGTKHYVAYDSLNNPSRNGSVGVEMVLSKDSWVIGESISITSWSTAEAK